MSRFSACLVLTVLFLMLGLTQAHAMLPFGVTLDGHPAVKVSEVYAIVAEPVPANAQLVADVQADMIIINVFPSDDKANVDSSAQALIIMIQDGTNTTTMDKSMDGRVLEPGTYLMNIVAGGDTARVVFTVK